MTKALIKTEAPLLTRKVKQYIDTGLSELATYLSLPLKPTALARVYEYISTTEKHLQSLKQAARDRTLALLIEQGERSTDAGTLRLEVDGWLLEARPTRTGYDPKKVEQLLRLRQLDPMTFMESKLSYVMGERTLAKMASVGFTEAEMDTCKYEESYAVQTPKKVEQEDDA